MSCVNIQAFVFYDMFNSSNIPLQKLKVLLMAHVSLGYYFPADIIS